MMPRVHRVDQVYVEQELSWCVTIYAWLQKACLGVSTVGQLVYEGMQWKSI